MRLDYHVEIDRHYYSVPHILLKAQVWVRITDHTIEIFHKHQRVASHVRTSGNRKHTTVMDHMPSNHRAYADWTPERLCRWAAKVGPNTEALIEVIMRERKHPVQGFRACLGILRLSMDHTGLFVGFTLAKQAIEPGKAIGMDRACISPRDGWRGGLRRCTGKRAALFVQAGSAMSSRI